MELQAYGGVGKKTLESKFLGSPREHHKMENGCSFTVCVMKQQTTPRKTKDNSEKRDGRTMVMVMMLRLLSYLLSLSFFFL
jgi:hypothetical protein